MKRLASLLIIFVLLVSVVPKVTAHPFFQSHIITWGETPGWSIREFGHHDHNAPIRYMITPGFTQRIDNAIRDAAILWNITGVVRIIEEPFPASGRLPNGVGMVIFGNFDPESIVIAGARIPHSSITSVTGHFTSRWTIEVNNRRVGSFNSRIMAHEFGHIIGLDDLYSPFNRDKLMYGFSDLTALAPTQADINGARVIQGHHTTHSFQWGACIHCRGLSTGIRYGGPQVIIDGSRAGHTINLSTERITFPSGFTPRSFSTNGGRNWWAVSDRNPQFANDRFPRMLNSTRGLTLHVSDHLLARGERQPPANSVVTFSTINRRPARPALRPNYSIARDITASTPGAWVLVSSLRGADIVAVRDGIEVGIATFNDRGRITSIPDANGFGIFPAATSAGITIPSIVGNRQQRVFYLVRTAPVQERDGTFTPASRIRSVRVNGEDRPPNIRVRERSELRRPGGAIRREASATLTVRANTFVSINGATTLHTERTTIDILGITGRIEIWRPATHNRPASAKQIIPRG